MLKKLVLEDGTFFVGNSFGSDNDAIGELVFHTGMTGYQEMLTDPSYCGQLLLLTYPLIGNYGINRSDFESMKPFARALLVREWEPEPSHYEKEQSLSSFLKEHNVVGLAGIDTRQLTRHLRDKGVMKAMITSIDRSISEVVEELLSFRPNKKVVEEVSTSRAYQAPGKGKRVVVMDFGMKHGILRELVKRECDVVVVPHNTTAQEIYRLNPDGVLLSNGPGDPKDCLEAVGTVKELLGNVPIFGICLGHQLLSLACGADTFKLPFGHRGANHPVREIKTGKVTITSQNHGYACDKNSLLNTDLEITHEAVNDQTVEGVAHRKYPAFSVQYHPEASPGPLDANDLFQQFIDLMVHTEMEAKNYVKA
ncbi:glutamine-hydrolyzing carbamoyl-phosphate synthase small subunit [Mangrovibacillus cuniculi]|uniref:Carbamoyl phosphate synthase small chain n=1 Tax=Mangrovibacillus cuniculi TaxID=2593652 RepID=A0A7S8HF94_9BACI|nr:glutamine-hydrolyzing carbamoyl-phosphate synthase small subunit [Mangrovibacillus cuniculi]QPC46281.1 glutamine-hydrolyzing carbamoyl-phosphate synthase small subunit [Mangrovibacillus cuniculi]